MTYVPAPDRYDQIPYRRCGRSGIKLPEISLGLWQNLAATARWTCSEPSSFARSIWV